MSDELARRETDTWVDLMGPVGQLATQIARTQFVPKAMQGQPASVAAAILTGREMGIGPMTSLRGIDVIEGRPSLTSEMLAARIFAAGHRIEWRAVTDERVTVRIERGDGLSEAEVTWTMHDARRAGLAGKSNWQKYPRAMLRARALSECAQLACPDVALGLDVVAPVEANPGPIQAAQAGATTVQVGRPEPVDNSEEPPLGIIEVPETERDTRGAHDATRASRDEKSSETVQETEPEPALITGPQMRKLGALIGQWEAMNGTKLDRDERRHFIAELAEVEELQSAKDLTRDQASKVIDALTELLRTMPIAEGEGP